MLSHISKIELQTIFLFSLSFSFFQFQKTVLQLDMARQWIINVLQLCLIFRLFNKCLAQTKSNDQIVLDSFAQQISSLRRTNCVFKRISTLPEGEYQEDRSKCGQVYYAVKNGSLTRLFATIYK